MEDDVRVTSLSLLAASINQHGAFECWQHMSSSPTCPSITTNGRLKMGLSGSADSQRFAISGVQIGSGEKKAARSPRDSFSSAERATAATLEREIVSWAWHEAHSAMANDIAMIMWSLASVGCEEQSLLRALIVRANALGEHFTPMEMVILWGALADLKVKIRQPETVCELLACVELEAAKFSIEQATRMLRAMRQCGVRTCGAVTALKLRRAGARALRQQATVSGIPHSCPLERNHVSPLTLIKFVLTPTSTAFSTTMPGQPLLALPPSSP